MNNPFQYSELHFKEEQRFRQIWIWLAIILAAAFPWYGLIRQVLLGEKFGNNPAPDWLLVLIWLAFGIGFPLLFFLLD